MTIETQIDLTWAGERWSEYMLASEREEARVSEKKRKPAIFHMKTRCTCHSTHIRQKPLTFHRWIWCSLCFRCKYHDGCCWWDAISAWSIFALHSNRKIKRVRSMPKNPMLQVHIIFNAYIDRRKICFFLCVFMKHANEQEYVMPINISIWKKHTQNLHPNGFFPRFASFDALVIEIRFGKGVQTTTAKTLPYKKKGLAHDRWEKFKYLPFNCVYVRMWTNEHTHRESNQDQTSEEEEEQQN